MSKSTVRLIGIGDDETMARVSRTGTHGDPTLYQTAPTPNHCPITYCNRTIKADMVKCPHGRNCWLGQQP